MGKLNNTVDYVEMYWIAPCQPQWIGVAASIDGVTVVSVDNVTSTVSLCPEGMHRVKFDNGWTVSGWFGSDNMGSGFGDFMARHKDYPDFVCGDYESGVFSHSRELLEKFVQNFPPYDAD